MANAFVIAAAASGSGKTTLSLGLMRSLHRRGIDVAPFKCGPDYIDTQFHTRASGRESENLDLFMSSPDFVRSIFGAHASRKGVSVVEGAMGMFDGYERWKGSAAHVAATLGLPVVLVIDARSAAYSVGATILGFSRFRSDIKVAGVVFNRVGSQRHLELLRQACDDAGVPLLGSLPRLDGLQTPSRHLGLTLTAQQEMEDFINRAADAVSRGVDIEALLKATEIRLAPEAERHSGSAPRRTIKVAVARDEAFNFIYPANLRAMQSNGDLAAGITEFSPLRDAHLPADTEMLYLPGGYPELYAAELESNASLRAEIRSFAESGAPVLAECGGMIYLGNKLDGHDMVGALPFRCTMQGARLHLGYRQIDIPGLTGLRGHEFHYSSLENADALQSCARQSDAMGRPVSTPLYSKKGIRAGYTHLYWAETDIFKLWNL